MNTEKFLEFNGKKLTLVNQDGKFYIALKPICEVLEIDWSTEKKRLENHFWMASTMVNITTVAADKKQRKMVCIPEKFVYGWLCSLNPRNEKLAEYQKECYDVLYNHFHNIISNRANELQQRNNLKLEHSKLHQNLLANDDYARLVELQQQIKKVNNNLNNFDNILLTGQMEIAFTN